MSDEIQFKKYTKRGADYHYLQINKAKIKQFNAFTEARYMKHIDLILKHLNNVGFGKKSLINVVDIGCGDGVLLYLLQKKIKEYSFKISGVDLSEDALKVAKSKIGEGNFIKNDVYNTGFQENSFDLIISSDVIEHVKQPEKMLAEIKRIAKKDALIIISTPIRHTEKPLDTMHAKEFFQQEFIDLASEFFNFIELAESHKQIHFLKYIKQTRLFKIGLNRYFYNIRSIFGKNPFLEEIKGQSDYPTYMFVVCSN